MIHEKRTATFSRSSPCLEVSLLITKPVLHRRHTDLYNLRLYLSL